MGFSSERKDLKYTMRAVQDTSLLMVWTVGEVHRHRKSRLTAVRGGPGSKARERTAGTERELCR